MNLKEKFKEWNKSWPDMSIEELNKKYKSREKLVYLFMAIPIFLLAVGLILIFTFELFNIVGGILIMYLAEFQFLKVLDLSNDLNRINLWIYLKEKLGD